MAKSKKDTRGPAFRRDEKDGESKGGRSSYKAKRSFTRNKSYRSKEKDAEGKGTARTAGRSFSGRREGDRDKPYRERRPESADRKPLRRGPGAPDRPAGTAKREGDERPWRQRGPEEERTERSSARTGGGSGFRRKDGDDRPPRRAGYRSSGDNERPARGGGYRDAEERPARRGPKRTDERPARRRRDEGEVSHRAAKRQGPEAEREERRPSARTRSERPETRERPKGRREPAERDRDTAPRRVKHEDFEGGRSFTPRQETRVKPGQQNRKPENEGLTRLNKYLANAGLASRREADTLIQSGAVKVNGVVIDQLGYKVKPGDKVTYGDEAVKGEKKVYLLLNKPKDYITTVDDPRERKTVMELIQGACRERVYPVGRLDRNTTGLLLFTNDGELTTKLTHPRYGVKKVYHVTLDKNLKADDFKALVDGIELEDGEAHADDLAFVGEGKREIGIEIHSGRNRIVRRMFEHLGYNVIKLDRVVFAGLTKKDLPRGKHRFLTAKEVAFLKMIG